MGGDMVSVSGRQQKISLQIGGPKEEDQKENDWARRQYLIWEGSLALAMFFFFKQKTTYEIMPSLVGSEMCIRDSTTILQTVYHTIST